MNNIEEIVKFNLAIGNKRGESSNVGNQQELIIEEYREVKEAYLKGDFDNMAKELCDPIVVCVGQLHTLGYDPDEMLKAVNDSNNTKFCITQEEIDATYKKYDELGIEIRPACHDEERIG